MSDVLDAVVTALIAGVVFFLLLTVWPKQKEQTRMTAFRQSVFFGVVFAILWYAF